MNRSLIGKLLVGGIILGAALSCRTTSNRSTSPTKLVGGQPASDQDFPGVMIWTTNDVALHESYCTGTKIAPDLILTAAHCVLLQSARSGEVYLGPWKRIEAMSPGARLQYTFTRNLESYDAETVELVELLLPPVVEECVNNPEMNRDLCQFRAPIPDVAVLRVAPAGSFATRPSVGVNFNAVKAGDLVHIMGYGSEGEDVTTPPRLKFAPVRVARTEELRQALDTTFATQDGFPQWDSFYGVVRTSDQQVNLGSGDSGGPVFNQTGDAVIGVNSDGFCPLENRYCQLTNNSIFVRLDSMAAHGITQWLNSLMAPPRTVKGN